MPSTLSISILIWRCCSDTTSRMRLWIDAPSSSSPVVVVVVVIIIIVSLAAVSPPPAVVPVGATAAAGGGRAEEKRPNGTSNLILSPGLASGGHATCTCTPPPSAVTTSKIMPGDTLGGTITW
jgi:hypothetical protein